MKVARKGAQKALSMVGRTAAETASMKALRWVGKKASLLVDQSVVHSALWATGMAAMMAERKVALKGAWMGIHWVDWMVDGTVVKKAWETETRWVELKDLRKVDEWVANSAC